MLSTAMRWTPLLPLLLCACMALDGSEPERGSQDPTPEPESEPTPESESAPAKSASSVPTAEKPVPPELVHDPQWDELVIDIATHYERWGRVDSSMRWAPLDCMLHMPPKARISAGRGTKAHEGKLYSVFAKDPVAYGFKASMMIPGTPDPFPGAIGRARQVLVKEAYHPRKLAPNERPSHLGMLGPVEKDGETWVPGDRAGLFITLELPADTPGTDQGWVYATVDADRKTILQAGEIPGCMDCHTKRPGRVFGLPDHPLPK